jgi:hypothetical protein
MHNGRSGITGGHEFNNGTRSTAKLCSRAVSDLNAPIRNADADRLRGGARRCASNKYLNGGRHSLCWRSSRMREGSSE